MLVQLENVGEGGGQRMWVQWVSVGVSGRVKYVDELCG